MNQRRTGLLVVNDKIECLGKRLAKIWDLLDDGQNARLTQILGKEKYEIYNMNNSRKIIKIAEEIYYKN